MSQRIEQPMEQGRLAPAPVARLAMPASEYGEDNTRFLWSPYLPVGDYTVLMAPGGTGKTILCCGIAAAVSTGASLLGNDCKREPGNVLIISAEDSGEVIKKRLAASGADLTRVYILDRDTSAGLSLVDGYDEFAATVQTYHPALVIIDPWHAFLGPDLNINKTNALRPVLQRLSGLGKKCECSMILVSHVNKKAQGENVNNAATGSVDVINAARSALMVVFDEEDESGRVMVHTKSNYAPYGPSIKYSITEEGGVEWTGYSDVTRQTLEAAARQRATPADILRRDRQKYEDDPIVKTIRALLAQSPDARWEGTMSDLMAEGVSVTRQPLAKTTRALSAAVGRLDNQLYADGIVHDRLPHGTGGGRHRFRVLHFDDVTEKDPALLDIPF